MLTVLIRSPWYGGGNGQWVNGKSLIRQRPIKKVVSKMILCEGIQGKPQTINRWHPAPS